MSSYIDQLSLKYLVNEDVLSRIYAKSTQTTLDQDLLIYKERIIELTIDLLNNVDKDNESLLAVKDSYNQFVSSCIWFFKNIDENSSNKDEQSSDTSETSNYSLYDRELVLTPIENETNTVKKLSILP